MNDENKPKEPLFQDNSQALTIQRDEAAIARVTQEIQAALVIGKKFPRDEIDAKARIIQACQRRGLAEVAEYEYSRGGTKILGPTIDLLRAIASRWGNVVWGWAEESRRDGESTVRVWAWDTQSNSRPERTFIVRHWRDTQAGGYKLTDERDIYELLSNQASRRVRSCLEEVIDSDIVADAVDQCRKTLKEGEKTPLRDRATAMVTAFAEFGVTKPMIEKRLGNNLDAVSENQLASLRRIFKALKDGVGTRDDYFKAEVTEPKFADNVEKEDHAAPEPKAKAPEPEPPPKVLKPVPVPANHAPEPVPEPTANTPLKQLRAELKTQKMSESTVLSFLADVGLTSEPYDSLEQVAINQPEVFRMLQEQYEDIIEKIKAYK